MLSVYYILTCSISKYVKLIKTTGTYYETILKKIINDLLELLIFMMK